MKQEVSVNKAIKRGHLMVNVPVMVCLIGIPAVSIFLNQNDVIPGWAVVIGFVLGFVLAWLIWSYMITKWRIWAFERVKNVHELKKRAIEEKLIWKDDHIFEKIEIRFKKDRIKLEELNHKFRTKDVYKDDPTVPPISKIYYSKKYSIIQLVISVGIISIGIVFLLNRNTPSYIIGTILAGIGLYYGFKSGRKVLDQKPQLIIDSNGIKLKSEPLKTWHEIFDEQVIQEHISNAGKSYLIFYDEIDMYIKVDIDELNVTHDRLETILRTYRIRHTKLTHKL